MGSSMTGISNQTTGTVPEPKYCPEQFIPWTEERKNRFRQMRSEGKSNKEIGAALGINPKIASKWALKLGCPLRETSTFTPERKNIFLEMRAAKKTSEEIATALDLDVRTVTKWAKRLGVSFPRASAWTEEATERCRTLYLSGMSTPAIEAIIGISKNKIVGRMFRIGVGHPKRAIRRTPEQAKARKRELDSKRRPSKKKVVGPRPKPLALPESLAADLATPQEQRRSLLQLSRRDCRWPVGYPGEADFFFCGAQKYKGASYCLRHYLVSTNYTPVPRNAQAR